MALSPFDLAGYFVDDAKDLFTARARGGKVHATKDIRAAGDEVEIPFREVLRKRLSRRYYVGHGHIVDSRLMTSPQIDAIVADDANTPVLFKAQNGSEYMPYESVYAVGEAKSTYDKDKKPIEVFSGTLREIKNGLQRTRVKFAMGTVGETNTIRQSELGLNPLFAFMLFVNGDEFRFLDVLPLYRTTPADELPSVVCVLDKGVLLRAAVVYEGGQYHMRGVVINPSTVEDAMSPVEHRWVFIKPKDLDLECTGGFSLAVLCMMLFGSLNQCMLQPPDMGIYINQALSRYPIEIE